MIFPRNSGHKERILKTSPLNHAHRMRFYKKRQTPNMKNAMLSTFADAIWKSNGYFLQEYKETEGQRKGKWRSNADLWFKVHSAHYLAEATQK